MRWRMRGGLMGEGGGRGRGRRRSVERVRRMMGGAMFAACLVVVGCLALNVLADNPVISIQNNRLFLDNVEFIIKGVAYSPSPIGQESMSSTGYGGGGFCSAKITPWYEWKSACYDSDYYDGSPDPYTPSRFPNGMLPIWQRDFAYIKSLGLNTIRLYNTNPSTLAATKEYTNLFTVPSGKDHATFIKYCEQMGIKVIYALFSDETSYLDLDENIFRRYLKWQIDEVGNSSSVIMWQIGNEMTTYWEGRSTNWNNTVYTQKINRMMGYIRSYTKTKWNRFIPVTSTIVNIGTMYNYLYKNWDVDVFTSNVFTTDFDSQFASNDDNYGITELACVYNKPFLMTETGPTWKPGTPYTAGVLNQIWYSVIKNIPNSLLGAVWFEHTDEPAKGKDFGLFSVAVATNSYGNRSDQTDVFLADSLGKKQQYYDAYSGTYNNQPYNYRADVFATLLKRNPYNALTNNPDTCATKYTLKACPGTSYPKCSGNGYCDRSRGTCTCLPGWSGSSCNVASCSCNSHGVCNPSVYPIECACNPGYWGSSCQYAVGSDKCFSLNGYNCTNGNGICANGGCQCHSGWTGVDCGVTDPGTGSINVQQFSVGCLQSAVFPVTAPATTTLTNQKCRYYCSTRGYSYAATSNGNTCQCGLTLSTTTTSTSCTSNCGGDANQRCGGTSQQSTYIAGRATDSGYKGCFPDNSSTRDLPVQMDSGSGSVDSCRNACSTSGYTYAGVQSGGQCFCGNTYGTQGGQTSDSDCSSPCSNDNTVNCGGTLRNSVYTSAVPVGYHLYMY